jgi:NADH:ubiquinone oxidoreductase subunit D
LADNNFEMSKQKQKVVTEEIITVEKPAEKEYSILNLGPTHPATHGIFQNILKMDGEIIREAESTVGYIHRAFEKIAETQTIQSDYATYRPSELLFLAYQQHGLAHDG